MTTNTAIADAANEPIELRRFEPAAVATMARLAFWQCARSNRVLLLGLLLLLPVLAAGLTRYYGDDRGASGFAPIRLARAEFAIVFMLLPHALVPLTALVLSAGMIQDEVEDQTLTYLVVRPIPKWSIYLSKLLAAAIVSSFMCSLFTALALVVLHWDAPNLWRDVLLIRAGKSAAVISLAAVTYCALFGLLGLLVRRSLALGVAYIVLMEGVLANIDFVVRRGTIMYYFRVLAKRWLDLAASPWTIDLEQSPATVTCIAVLLGTVVVLSAIAAAVFSSREYRLKTPEGGS